METYFLAYYSYPISVLLSLISALINGTLLLKYLLRPSLWSTINTLTSITVFINVLISCILFIHHNNLLDKSESDKREFHCMMSLLLYVLYTSTMISLQSGMVHINHENV